MTEQPLPSKSQIDKLGERLRAVPQVEADLVLLEEWRRSFDGALDTALRLLGTLTGLKVVPADGEKVQTLSARRGKTTGSIVAKLNRERTRLSSMQDIVGCRIVVGSLAAQDEIVRQIAALVVARAPRDLRSEPHHGYRAVHVVLDIEDRLVEVQVRTLFQHIWADYSEALSRRYGVEIKYGGGPERQRERLLRLSDLFRQLEEAAPTDAELKPLAAQLAEGILEVISGRIDSRVIELPGEHPSEE